MCVKGVDKNCGEMCGTVWDSLIGVRNLVTKLCRIYLRVSTESQDLGVDAQRTMCERYAHAHGLTILDTYVDIGVSGAMMPQDRPELSRLLACLGRGESLLAAKRDRLARDLMAVALVEHACRKVGASLHTADGASGDELLAGILDVFARHERSMIRQRTTAALAAKRARGERTGTVPYGWRQDALGQPLRPHEGETAVLEAGRALRATGLGWRAIASRLAEDGHRSRKGTPIPWQNVRRMLLQ